MVVSMVVCSVVVMAAVMEENSVVLLAGWLEFWKVVTTVVAMVDDSVDL